MSSTALHSTCTQALPRPSAARKSARASERTAAMPSCRVRPPATAVSDDDGGGGGGGGGAGECECGGFGGGECECDGGITATSVNANVDGDIVVDVDFDVDAADEAATAEERRSWSSCLRR
jgi:hypothetical protein